MDRIEELAKRVKKITELDPDNEGSIEDAEYAIAFTPLDVIEYLLDVLDNYTMEV
jgi:hypothetical protein